MEEINIFKSTKAIFFDFDNTLVSFEEKSNEALQKVVEDIYNYLTENYPSKKIQKDEIKRIVFETSKALDEEGIYDRKIWWQSSLDKLGIKAEMEDLYEWTQIYWSIASNNTPYEDALDLIEYLKRKGFKLGIITNSDGEWGDKKSRLAKFPLISYIDIVIIGGENNIKPKPNVEPFIVACEKIGFSTSSCVMVGDDPVKDCLASRKAGLRSILVDRNGRVKHAELYADYVVRSLKELEEIF
ncbi:HAD family hydrolase [Stygiolobus caldivivus]|uniref:2-haloalkanoic acid dehalogenase n=1 Tax=Stygiolobus caldivivus TaxID=2824673 RepID=A0A8D5U6T9_9CREN|nr:HAD family hydrolase [Stygiolobus caldivivus]BCU70631.1 2-haloalkanoic acid dehalogenase [Stygiolobus caldivivus]